MLTRDAALQLLAAQNPDPHLMHHSLQSEAVLRGLAAHLNQDVELWGLAGLLHDVDFAHTKQTPERHGLMAMDILGDALPAEALTAIRAHNSECTGEEPTTPLDFALRAGESVTGLVAANALVRPEGMDGMKPKSLKKKMKEKAFAANVSRERIREYEKLGLEAGDFFQIAIDAMAPIAAETGLAK
ncbi:MAG: HD domain-containing protein [Desulfovibrionaceae bacterium]|jgi:putative nucleotidyltransferase with HDIG domain|nr:HD domain-containing protein [Desulfovibrionaceae bacterium]